MRRGLHRRYGRHGRGPVLRRSRRGAKSRRRAAGRSSDAVDQRKPAGRRGHAADGRADVNRGRGRVRRPVRA
ncbi:MAG: hypothetical protein F4088_02035 [Chloroflexi bacterium]|nr:hypothetical protein [Chloroflexota bacterium]MYJ57690.1 hypothetical protein [Chloroflexota bacterium]